MMDLRVVPVAKEDLKDVLRRIIADDWHAKDLAAALLADIPEPKHLSSEDVGGWLRGRLDEYKMLLDALEVKFFANPDLFAKIGVKITTGKATKKLEEQ